MKEKILELRAQGYTYNQIVKALGCSKATVAYHCGDGQKEKSAERTKQGRKQTPIVYKITRFRQFKDKKVKIKSEKPHTVIHKIQDKVRCFQRNRSTKGTFLEGREYNFTAKEFIEYIGDNPKCYLTGKDIDILKPDTYQFDHIIPVYAGGDNSLENLGLTISKANLAKGKMDLEEFIELCYDVLKHFEIIEDI